MVILHTKLVVPSYTRARVPRPRVAEAIRRRLGEAAVLVVAPTGYGKTVVLAEVADGDDAPLVWLQLDESDNDPVALLTALAEGVRRAFPALDRNLDGLVDPEPAGQEDRLLAILVNAFMEQPAGAWTLVLDDLHLLTNPPALAVVERLVEFPPPGARILIASRTLPALPVHRWRARGTLRLVDMHELRFTHAEAAAWLRRDLPTLSDAAVTRLVDRTEGWGAGLHLARGLISGPPHGAAGPDDADPPRAAQHDDPAAEDAATALAERLTGANPVVGDYLMDEVFARQPAEWQRFMLDTSVLPLLDAARCDALVGEDAQRGWSAGMLEALTRSHTFLQRLDTQERWYRYHPLFREFLLERLERREPQRAVALRRKAARATEASGDVDGAIGFYLDSGATGDAVRLLEAHGTDMLRHGRGEALHRWLLRLGPDVGTSARVQLLAGRVLRRRGRLQAATSVLQEAQEHADASPGLVCEARTELASIARAQGDYRRASECAVSATLLEAKSAPAGVNAAAWMERAKCEGHLRGMAGGRTLAERALRELDRPEADPVDRRVRATLLGSLGQICWWQGDVDAAVSNLERALEGLGEDDTIRAADVRLDLATPTLYRRDHEAAHLHAETALAAYQRHEAKDRLPAAYAVLGNIHTRAGDLDRAESLLRSAMSLAQEIDGASYDRVMAAGYLAHVLDLQGRSDEASQVAQEALWRHEGAPIVYEVYVCQSVLADTYLSAGRWDEAERIYEQLAEIGEARQYRIPLALVHFGRGYLALERGDTERGLAWATRSVEMLAPTHAWQLYADQGPRAATVLAALRPLRPDDPFLDRVEAGLRAAADRDVTVPGRAVGFARADVEIDVLGELAVRVGGEPVAGQAFVSAKARDLLAFLVVRREEGVTIEQALEALWPGEPERAKTAFHTALYRLRGALRRGGDDSTKFVLVERGRYRLDVARFDVDADRFETLTSQAREASGARQAVLLQQAVDLVRGDVLADLDYAWVDAERRRFRDSASDALYRLGDLRLALGAREEALDVARRYVAWDALDERAHLLEMRAYGALGDAAGVEKTYRTLTRVLRDELDVEPALETERLYRDLSGRA